MEDSLISLVPKIVEHGLNTSPNEGNGYGVALGLSLFFAFTFAAVAAYIYREKQRQTQGYIKRLEKLQDAHRRELAKQRGNLQ